MLIEALYDRPFGTHRPSRSIEALRALGNGLSVSGSGMKLASALRRVCFAVSSAPYDVEVFPTVFARLRPATNRTEKRVFLAPQQWDGEERDALHALLLASNEAAPFVFVDVGANVGLYGLALASVARREVRPLKVIAVEPDPTNRSRLEINVAASGLGDVFAVEPVAVGRRSGTGRLTEVARNRGEVRVTRHGDGAAVRVDTLADVLARNGVNAVDAMKVDVEGMDHEVMAGLFEQAPETLWPRLLIVELGHEAGPSPLLDLIVANGYRVEARTKLNVVAIRKDQVSAADCAVTPMRTV